MEKTMMTENTERNATDMLNSGLSLLRDAYQSDLRDLARDLVEECRSGDIPDRDELFTRVNETCDGCHWVIYTQKAQVVLLVSQNDSAGIDNLGPDGFDWQHGIPWSQLAYFAMEQDLLAAIESEGLDVNDDSEWRETEEDADE